MDLWAMRAQKNRRDSREIPGDHGSPISGAFFGEGPASLLISECPRYECRLRHQKYGRLL